VLELCFVIFVIIGSDFVKISLFRAWNRKIQTLLSVIIGENGDY